MRRKLPGGWNARPSPHPCGVGPVLVARIAGSRTRGKLVLGAEVIPCALGRTGTTRRKREGDGSTPVGVWAAVAVRWREDRLARMRTLMPLHGTRRDEGWCDDVRSPLYNRPVRLPCGAGHEDMWRADGLYDVVVVLDYNLRHPVRHAGSAIFLHVAAPDISPTAGCIAITRAAMLRLLPRLGRRSRFRVLG